ncbi:RNA polymerase sigma factor [Streptomyces iconiensis]|uniref:Sigma-70 family RNA polymerase sigma factor n=1 Tax=Streptomyces iconiensis TaxID=1384038 RepID=A0ABT7A0T9_9ACTN|nr:sigma-70 family RNA polymerase sigma factor [Streptomyces iconiensis]MDJ1134945.1 sigma-70 family RNA polymerase sigma factor [Streptomyces iconiensis]
MNDQRAEIEAARNGDRAALDRLAERWLPLVYNVVGRALNGHADVDDVVQETMLRAVRHLPELRDPDGFRSWLVAIAVRQVRERHRKAARSIPHEDAYDLTAPDFAGLAIARLELDGERREVAEAVRWLAARDREVLSLWWLETGGELTRTELAAALRVDRRHAAVRVQRMKERLAAARRLVRALERGTCGELSALTSGWDGRPDSVWRKRMARHLRGCRTCGSRDQDFVPPERLLSGLALVPVPAGLALGAVLAGAKPVAAAGLSAASAGWLSTWTGKAVAVAAGASLAAGGTYAVHHYADEPPQPRTPAAAAPPSTSPSGPPTAPPSPAVREAPASPRTTAPAYGSVVDRTDTPPDPGRRPAPLPDRGGSGLDSSGDPSAHLVHRGESVTLRGTGYVRVRWQITTGHRDGALTMPAWTRLRGKLFHVASGGGRRMDEGPGAPLPDRVVLPPGTQRMWQNEYFWLDGSVVLHQNQRGADYGITIQPTDHAAVSADLHTRGIRYGLVRDPGTALAPVPQYATRAAPPDPATVPRDSHLKP